MPNTNASFSPKMRSDELKQQIGKLEQLDHRAPVLPTLERFDAETEDLLGRLYGTSHKYVETYKYATVAETEALVNLPESAQEPLAKDLPKPPSSSVGKCCSVSSRNCRTWKPGKYPC